MPHPQNRSTPCRRDDSGEDLKREADAFAEEALAAIARNRAVIVIPRRARLAWRLGRLFPGLAEKASEKFVTIERRHRSP